MLAIIGGSGIYDLPGLEAGDEQDVMTPYGAPSADLVIGKYGGGKDIVFLARHGKSHQYLPHEVNYRANIWALKKLGVSRIIGISAVGSLRADLKPGDLCLADQYFDFVKGQREKSFFGNGLAAHVSTAEPVCPILADGLVKAGQGLGIKVKGGLTYGCVDGPRLGTRAESLFLKNAANCDLVGMTNVPEAFLAREAQICYSTLSIVTDYDCWLDDPAQHVSVEQVISRYGESLATARKLVGAFLESDGGPAPDCGCRHSLDSAVLTPMDHLDIDSRALLDLLKR